MLSESAREKLSRYQFVLMERDAMMKDIRGEERKRDVVMLYQPPLNMLACAFADQVLEDEVRDVMINEHP